MLAQVLVLVLVLLLLFVPLVPFVCRTTTTTTTATTATTAAAATARATTTTPFPRPPTTLLRTPAAVTANQRLDTQAAEADPADGNRCLVPHRGMEQLTCSYVY